MKIFKPAIYAIAVLVVINLFVWTAVILENREGILRVVYLDVGQGDATFIEAPNGNQVLIDASLDGSVIEKLSELMPFYDRSIDVVIATHPHSDHIGGLPPLFEKFKIGIVLDSGNNAPSQAYDAYRAVLEQRNVRVISARRGMKVFLDEDIYLDILFPDRDTKGWDADDSSVWSRLVFGSTSFLFTGDSPQKMEDYVMKLEGDRLVSTILKAGHHGSKTSSGAKFVDLVSPEYGIVSVGIENSYGHPHQETLDTFASSSIMLMSTAEVGTIQFRSDGFNIMQAR